MAKVRGTQREMPLAFEICNNTVYERAQIKRIEVKATESEFGFLVGSMKKGNILLLNGMKKTAWKARWLLLNLQN